MPFCSNCGKFSVTLTQQKLCTTCNELLYEGKISEERFRKQQSRLHNDASMSLLHYRSETNLQRSQSDSQYPSEEPYIQRQDTSNSGQRYDEQEDGLANFALGLIALGYLLLFLNSVVLSAVTSVCGLIAAFIAKRREMTQNWRPQVAIGVGTLFWAVFIFFYVIKLAGF